MLSSNPLLLRDKLRVVSTLLYVAAPRGSLWRNYFSVSSTYFSVFFFPFLLIYVICRICSASFWISFRVNCSICSYRFGVSEGGDQDPPMSPSWMGTLGFSEWVVEREEEEDLGEKARFTLKVNKAFTHFVKSVTFLGWKSESFQKF